MEAAGGVHPMDIKKPWSHCFGMLLKDREFWEWELEKPALTIVAKAGKSPHSSARTRW